VLPIVSCIKCCSVLQRDVVCCRVLQCFAVCSPYSVVHKIAVCCIWYLAQNCQDSVLQCVVTCCTELMCVIVNCSVFWRVYHIMSGAKLSKLAQQLIELTWRLHLLAKCVVVIVHCSYRVLLL